MGCYYRSGGEGGGGEKLLDSSCVLKVELKRLADELDVECKGKRTNPVFGPSSLDAGAID